MKKYALLSFFVACALSAHATYEDDNEFLEDAKHNGVAFLSQQQAKATLEYIKLHPETQQPKTDTSKQDITGYWLPLFRGFFPEITFELVWDEDEPNVYSVIKDGKKIVILCGGLVRMQSLKAEGVVMALAHGVGRLEGGAPLINNNKYSCSAQADYYGFYIISRKVFVINDWRNHVGNAYDQLHEFLQLVNEAGAQSGTNPCLDPSLDCRLKTMQRGEILGTTLPECGGGKAPQLLQLEASVVVKSSKQIDLTFNLDIQEGSYENLASYRIQSSQHTNINVTDVKLDDSRASILHLTTIEMAPGNYSITVSNLLSTENAKLDPQASSANFTVPDDLNPLNPDL